MTTLTAALLGLEHPHSLAHLRTLQQLPEVERILLWAPDAETLARVQRDHGRKIAAAFTDLDALLAKNDLFFAIAAIRNDLGPDIFCRVLSAGKHLMAEKPIGRTAADTQQVIDAARRAGVKLGVCYQNRAGPWLQDARAIIQQGLLGPLISVEIRLITTQVQFRTPSHWLFRHEQSGGGILSWLGCHYIDQLRYLTGDEIVSVAAEVATRSGEAIDVEDAVTLSMRLQSGALASLHAGYMLALSGGGYFNKSGYDIYFGVNGRLGRLYWHAAAYPESIYVETTHPAWAAAPQRTFQYTVADSPAYGRVYGEQFMRRFIHAAQGQGDVPAGGEDRPTSPVAPGGGLRLKQRKRKKMMKITDYRWIGLLVHDYEATCNFFKHELGLKLVSTDDTKEVAMFRFPSGQSIEVYGPSNRTRKAKYQHFNGPVIGLEADDIVAARAELLAKGVVFVSEIEELEDGSVKWAYFWGLDGQFYSLHQHGN
jgi:predicted dehydrogenase/predicted enzyme related to lactoylglutathione lyase